MSTFLANLFNQTAAFFETLTGVSLGFGGPFPVFQQRQRKNFSAKVVRADDLLVLTLDFYNLRLDANLLQREGAGDAFVIVHFPPQSIAEQSFLENGSNDPLFGPPVAARLAGESRIVFHLDPTLLPLEFSLEPILDALSKCAPLVREEIGAPPVTPPVGGFAEFGRLRSQFTAIEAPWRLILSPHPEGRWAHSPQAVKVGTKIELWHTRLGVRPKAGSGIDETSPQSRTARAVFSPDFAPLGLEAPDEKDLTPFRSSLKRYNRNQLVHATANRALEGNKPVAVKRLMLSSLGSWLDVHGAWNIENINLVEWRHLSTLGRDQFVRVVEKGFAFPLGNRIVKITITERKLNKGLDGALQDTPVAYLRSRSFIVVLEPEKRYLHRAFPFRKITFKTLITPNLIDPPADEDTINLPVGGAKPFWPRYEVNGEPRDVLFEIEGVDWEGNIISFAAPQIFVPDSADTDEGIKKLVDAYNDPEDYEDYEPAPAGLNHVPEESERRKRPMGGQKIAFAPSQKSGDTTFETETFYLGALRADGRPHFLPGMSGAIVNHSALRQISKNAPPLFIRYDESYSDADASSFGNPGEVFARVDASKNKVDQLDFPVEKTGGLVAPNFTPEGFSRNFGAIGDADNFAKGTFNPVDIFKDIKILGGIPLDKIFKSIPFTFPNQAGETVPGLTTVRTKADLGGGEKDVIETRYAWKAGFDQLQDQPSFKPSQDAIFELESIIDTPLDGATTSRFQVTGKLERFEIVLPGENVDKQLIGVQFESIHFTAGSNQKVDVSVSFRGIEFKGQLSFVNDICNYLPQEGFNDPPYLDVSAEGVNSGYTLGIPTIGIGIFSLQNVSLSAGFHLPFRGGAAGFRFAFCERDHPFLLTVSMFGGGGFFAIDLDMEKVTNVEASLEFGAVVALNLGVASGAASVTGGVYYQKSGKEFQISAFFRAAGALSVLGIITVSIELYVSLNYALKSATAHGGKLYGTASVKVKIKIAFFSKSVSVSIEREFAGSDPTFTEMLTQDDWAEYCGAFAPEPV